MRFLLLLVLVAACSKKKAEDAPAPAPASGTAAPKPTDPDPDEQPTPTEAAQTDAPTKEAAIARLRALLAALEANDYAKAAGYFAVADVPADKVEAGLGKLIENREISGPGIDVLAAKGTWGKLAEVFDADRAARFAEKAKVPVDECYGFAAEGTGANASVGFHWDGKELRLIRLNNVGKL